MVVKTKLYLVVKLYLVPTFGTNMDILKSNALSTNEPTFGLSLSASNYPMWRDGIMMSLPCIGHYRF